MLGLVKYGLLWASLHAEEKEEGQGMVEYGLIIALVSVVAIAALILIGDGVGAAFDSVVAAFPGGGGDEGGND